MRLIRNIFFTIVIMIVIFLAGAYALPDKVSIAREIQINAPAEKVFGHVNDLRKFQAWSPWAVIDSDMKVVYSGAEFGKGQVMAWTSNDPNVGSGSQTITASVANEKVETRLDFGKMGFADASWTLESAGGGTRIIWSFKTDLGSHPLNRWMGLLFDGWIGKDYEKGLKALKEIVEREL